MADDSDYMVPCAYCGGRIRFYDGVRQPHVHTVTRRSQSAVIEPKPNVVGLSDEQWERIVRSSRPTEHEELLTELENYRNQPSLDPETRLEYAVALRTEQVERKALQQRIDNAMADLALPYPDQDRSFPLNTSSDWEERAARARRSLATPEKQSAAAAPSA